MTSRLVLSDIGEEELCRIAELVALAVRPGEMIALRGDLGAGKTTFARALIRAVLDEPDADVPSPTFNLLQTYETRRFPIVHLDLYRLSDPREVEELVGGDGLAAGVAIVEWPDRAPQLLASDRLDVHLAETASADHRAIELAGCGAWQGRLARVGEMHRFLTCELGRDTWGRARLGYLQGDASPRAYARLCVDGASHVLMDAPRRADGPPVRNGLPYSRIAHLAEDVRPFLAVARALGRIGIAAPRVVAEDLQNGFLLLEDLGDLTFGQALAAGYQQRDLWATAVDVLVVLRTSGPPGTLPASGSYGHELPVYDRDALGIEVELLLDWYWPTLKGGPPPADVRQEFSQSWNAQFDQLLSLPKGWVLRDYHSPNLMWRPQRSGMTKVGVLDFQDAVQGPWAYDLVSLLQDARTDVPRSLEVELFAQYCSRVAAIEPDFDHNSFAHAYAALGAQRNTKILGIFARLAQRDGKTAYLHHIPRIWGYLGRNLEHPALAPLRLCYDRHFPQPVRAAAAPA